MYEDQKKDSDLGHPDSAIRLASAVHRFKVPQIDPERKISFVKSFKTTGSHEKTRKALIKADDARNQLMEACRANKVSAERVIGDAKRYIPLIHQILLSCKVQPEVARLDERLLFEWVSGVEGINNNPSSSSSSSPNKKKKGASAGGSSTTRVYKSEALMFDMVMSILCEGLGHAVSATEQSVSGEFAAASREYAAAAGVFQFLAEDHLPKWIAKGSNVDEATLPIECSLGTASAIHTLFLANGQQMAVATVLIKPGVPNYSLLAKLCLGIQELLDAFVSRMRKEAFDCMSRMDADFFTLLNFQTNLHKALSLYFQARSLWDKHDYGIAIALLSEALAGIKTKSSEGDVGVPDISKTRALSPLQKDLVDLRSHMTKLLKAWEVDNSHVYFESVPQTIPPERKLQEGLKMGKQTPYVLEEVEPLLLQLPQEKGSKSKPSSAAKVERSDSDLARQLQEELNRTSI